jgi:hypothetical protein
MDHTGADKPYTGLARPYGDENCDDGDLRILDILVRHHQLTAYPCVYDHVYVHGVYFHVCFHVSNVDH